MNCTFRPLPRWPEVPTRNRRESQFRATYKQTLELLERELEYLRARNVVGQIGLEERDIRQDGLPRSDARQPAHPGVIVSFDSRHGALSYPCDTYSDWKANLRAIALSLEALRAVDRYGVTKRAEQYQGWQPQALPNNRDAVTDRHMAAVLLERLSDDSHTRLLSDPAAAKEAYRRAVRVAHPDSGGDAETFRKVQAAYELLEAGR